jgi:anti-anti-sigma factor
LRDEAEEGSHVLAPKDRQGLADMTEPSEAFSATVVECRGDALVVVAGELDMATAPELSRTLDPLVDGGLSGLVLDFSELTFLDSSGIAVLIDTQQRLAPKGRQLSIRSAQPGAMKVFEISGLLDFLQVEGDAPAETATD